MVNGEFHSSITQGNVGVELVDTKRVMFDVLADNTPGASSKMSNLDSTTVLTNTMGSNINPTKYMSELLTGYGMGFSNGGMGEVGTNDDILTNSYNSLVQLNPDLQYSQVPFLRMLQEIHKESMVNGYTLTPNSIDLRNLKILFPDIGTHDTNIEIVKIDSPLTKAMLIQQLAGADIESKVASEIGLKLSSFLPKISMEDIHLLILPNISNGGFGNIVVDHHIPNCYILTAVPLANSIAPQSMNRLLNMIKSYAIQEFYLPYNYPNMTTTVDIQLNIRGMAHVKVGINHDEDVLSRGGSAVTDGRTVSYNQYLQPTHITVPLFSTSYMLPILQKSKTEVHFVDVNTNQIEHVSNSIEEAIEFCLNQGILDIPQTVERFKEFMDIDRPIAGKWYVMRKDFVTDVKDVLDTITPTYNGGEVAHMSNIITPPQEEVVVPSYVMGDDNVVTPIIVDNNTTETYQL